MLGVDAAVSATPAPAPAETNLSSPCGLPFASFARGGLFLAEASPPFAGAPREASTITSATRIASLVARISDKSFNISDASKFIAFKHTDTNARNPTAPQRGSQAAIIFRWEQAAISHRGTHRVRSRKDLAETSHLRRPIP